MLLSICIPTYNRAHTLYSLLNSIEIELNSVNGYKECVEIVISDNASTDNTREIVSAFLSKGLPINYLQLDKNYGFGININNAVEHSIGTYCWLMGSDDELCKGAIGVILKTLSLTPDIIIGNAITNNHKRNFLASSNEMYNISCDSSLSHFINDCNEISSLFAFISALVIKKAFWNSYALSEEMIRHPYTHQIRLLNLIKNNTTNVYYLSQPIVNTGHEKNEWNKSIFNHLCLDCFTLHHISRDIYDENEKIKEAISYLIQKQYGTLKVIISRSASSTREWNDLIPIFNYFSIYEALLNKRQLDVIVYFMYRCAKKIKAFKNYVIQKI